MMACLAEARTAPSTLRQRHALEQTNFNKYKYINAEE